MTSNDAVTALRRFGLGPRPGEPQLIAPDPRSFVLEQLDSANVPELAGLPNSAALWQEAHRFRLARSKADEVMVMGGDMDGATELIRPDDLARSEIEARFRHGLRTDLPLLERLVGFWSNHFSVAMQNVFLRSAAGAYERETVRPNVLGRFRDMLHAAVRHPVMLFYLDNHRSIGPNSVAGQRRRRGLNENLAREILELHTVGVNGGFTQDDVINFARALTGWTVRGADDDAHGTFLFRPQWHEPGAVTVMGRTYPENGVEQAEAILDDLAAHPTTARHVARKLALHFVGEHATLSLVERLASEFLRNDGDLAAVTRSLVSSEEAWQAEPRKLLPPYDFVLAFFRALEETPRFTAVAKALRTFGHFTWTAPSPAGWPDEDDAWTGPHAVVERLDWVTRIVARSSKAVGSNIIAYADGLFADTLSEFTRQAIARAETREQALALLFMSAEFQRR